jgi:arylsulfatase A
VPTVASFCNAKLPPNPLDGVDLSRLLTGESNRVDRGTILYFAVSRHQEVLECARKGNWKLRIAQGNGEIYINDWLGGSCLPKEHLLLPQPELYNLELDPAESYDAAVDHPEKVKEIQRDIEALIPTFPENVQKAYAEMKAHPGSPMTPPGAATRPGNLVAPKWIWIPKSRRGKR